MIVTLATENRSAPMKSAVQNVSKAFRALGARLRHAVKLVYQQCWLEFFNGTEESGRSDITRKQRAINQRRQQIK